MKYMVTIPEQYFGEVLGMLNKLGAWLDTADNAEGVFKIETRAPEENMSGFREWLSDISDGTGNISEIV